MREKREDEKGRGKEMGRKDRRDERKKEGRRAFLTLSNDTTIALCFLFSTD